MSPTVADTMGVRASAESGETGRDRNRIVDKYLATVHSSNYGRQTTPLYPLISTSVSVTLRWDVWAQRWFELYIRNKTTGEFEAYDDNIQAECSIGEIIRPDYRVDGLQSETENIFRIDAVNMCGRELVSSPLTVQYTTGGRHILIIHAK